MSNNPQKSILQQLQNTANESQVSTSSDSSNVTKESSQSNNDSDNEEDAESMVAEAQLAQAQKDADQQQINSNRDDSVSSQSNSSVSSNSQDSDSISEEKANLQPTDDKQGQEKNIDSEIDANSSDDNEASQVTSNNDSNSDSDLATQPQAQSNLEKNNSKANDDLQDVSSPNFFLLKSQALHNKFLSLLQKDYYNHTLNNSSAFNAIIALDKFAFNNLYHGVNKIIQYTNRRNNEVEDDTNHMKEQASKGAKTIKLWQSEGIFANLSSEMRTLSNVVNDPRFQTFAKKIKGEDVQVPKTLREKGIKAKNAIDKREQQKTKQGGSSSK